jgi:cysteine desulfurase
LSKSIYLDYNSTSPLSESVKAFLKEGKFLFANPSSLHGEGKLAKKSIRNSKQSMYNFFSISEKEYNLYFHSGASESISTFFSNTEDDSFVIGFNSDHPAVKSSIKYYCKDYIMLNPLSSGEFPLEEVNKLLSEKSSKKVYLNYTHISNESGVKWPLELLERLKHDSLFIHVDNVQAIGKTQDAFNLNSKAQFYSFSSHKFGALKGQGFAFVSKNLSLDPIIRGGSQQEMRSGTINEMGIKTTELALGDALKHQESLEELYKLRLDASELLRDVLGDKVIIPNSSDSTTLQFIHKNMRADLMLIQFDLAGICVSSGSACSSGSVEDSAYLKSIGLSQYAKNGIRISFGYPSLEQKDEILTSLKKVFNKL